MTDPFELLFRREAGRIVASLTRLMGARHLPLAEEAAQEAMVRALRTWPFRGEPPQPAAWLHAVARNYALDQLRRAAAWREREPELIRMFDAQPAANPMDETLAMMLLCCHPDLPVDSQIALTLKSVCGFSTREIAAAFFIREEAIAQRIVRAKRVIADRQLELEIPAGAELEARLDLVCHLLYAMFNEGYFASGGATALRTDLCHEAVRLLRAVLETGQARPERYALLALFHLHLARFAARVDGAGELIEFEDIDPAQFDAGHLRQADTALEKAMLAPSLSVWHVEAAIAAAHCERPLRWATIAGYYEVLERMKPEPVVRLNRAIALHYSGDRAAADALLARAAAEPQLRSYAPLLATRARFLAEQGDPVGARAAYSRALACAISTPARDYLSRQLDRLRHPG